MNVFIEIKKVLNTKKTRSFTPHPRRGTERLFFLSRLFPFENSGEHGCPQGKTFSHV
jgi:hypothetical protein